MNARQIEIFCAIMRDGTLTAAAEAFGVSQPAMSKALRQFEEQIGYRLFELRGKRLVPTPEAALLHTQADRFVREFEVLRHHSDRIRFKKFGLLRVGATIPTTLGVLPDAVAAFRTHYPNVVLEIHTAVAKDIAEQVGLGEIEMGLTMSLFERPKLRCEVLGESEIMVAAKEGSLLARREEVTPIELQDQTIIGYGSTMFSGLLLDKAFESYGLRRNVDIEVSLSIAALPLVQQGIGIAFVDKLIPWRNFPGIALVPFRPIVSQAVTLVTNMVLPQSRFSKEFADCLRSSIRARMKGGAIRQKARSDDVQEAEREWDRKRLRGLPR